MRTHCHHGRYFQILWAVPLSICYWVQLDRCRCNVCYVEKYRKQPKVLFFDTATISLFNLFHWIWEMRRNLIFYTLFYRYHGEEDDRISVASRKMTAYAKTDCIGASKGLFFGLLTLVCGMICLILFFVLIGHNNQQVSQLAIFLADLSHCAILIVCILATLLGFIR